MRTISIYIITGILISFFLRTSIKDDLEIYTHFEVTTDAYETIVNNINDDIYTEPNIGAQISSITNESDFKTEE
ncbi:hypothetical protein IWQ47_004699 [Aquimarina sp. EL_43]|uniref:hypothetical protein n=1 Tax=unclassified Aquimarina TaxID=2627091 RepID=UPI0018CADB08|nr:MULTISPECIES: hypothetical protein [unclassified Aquimarina]MBG6133374.1 hypothetical protein [Aquimarina sp. EL_35]MBG6153447.1 hypothetical protein [Aquimarina sp. EL_32]MBG6171603.1 hypothetical protein [Aquimarina sp. EL_43]